MQLPDSLGEPAIADVVSIHALGAAAETAIKIEISLYLGSQVLSWSNWSGAAVGAHFKGEVMKPNITQTLVDEHGLILRMLALVEHHANCLRDGELVDWQFFLDAVDFIRQFADRFHHAKEEDILFESLVANGMPREHSPVAAMLMEHERGRDHVRKMEMAVRQILAGDRGWQVELVGHALGFAELLRSHIQKEDQILYPLAERIIPEAARAEILDGYRQAQALAASGLGQDYLRLVERWEAKVAGLPNEAVIG
jgi:hemerythrin-like domain-containing protein